MFSDLKECYPHLKSQRQQWLITAVENWDRRQLKTNEGHDFSLEDLISDRNIFRQIPLSIPFRMTAVLESLSEKLSAYCPQDTPLDAGPYQVDRYFEMFKDFFNRFGMKNLVKITLLAHRRLDKMGLMPDTSRLINLIPDGMIDRLPFLKAEWFSKFTTKILREEIIFESLIHLLKMDDDHFDKISDATFKMTRPFRIDYPALPDMNNIIPFVYYQADFLYNGDQSFTCLEKVSEAIPSLAQENTDDIILYQGLRKKVSELCPHFTAKMISSVLSISDTTESGLLPLSVKIYLTRQFHDAFSRKNPAHPGSIILPDHLSENNLFQQFHPVVHFTRQLMTTLIQRSFRHVAAPVLMANELKDQGFDSTDSRAMIILFGVFYQVLDAKSKIDYYGESESDVQNIINWALDDIHLWERSFETISL